MSLFGPDRPDARPLAQRQADLLLVAAQVHSLARQYDDHAAALLEAGFVQWQRDTVYPQTVARWIEECGR